MNSEKGLIDCRSLRIDYHLLDMWSIQGGISRFAVGKRSKMCFKIDQKDERKTDMEIKKNETYLSN